MSGDPTMTQQLLNRAAAGDAAAFEELFQRHRRRLLQAIAFRMDRRMAGRVDASDILQEAYLEAYRRLPKYLQQRNMPFFLWLRWIAREKIIGCHRRHIGAEKRNLSAEVPLIPADSSARLVSVIVGRDPSPSHEYAKAELAEHLRVALSRLDEDERELILWRHFEQLSARETAELLEITEAAATKRYVRALGRLRVQLLELGVSRTAF